MRLPRLARRTVRFRLTLMYGALFLACGIVLVGITYALAAQSTPSAYTISGPNGDTNGLAQETTNPGGDRSAHSTSREVSGVGVTGVADTEQADAIARRTEQLARAQRAEHLRSLLTQSGIALAITTVISLGLGWIVAGQLLRRLQRVTAAARTISVNNLHERLAMDGPEDELKDLGDTFDQLLGRLEAGFEAQRRFIANVSHELRTPMARQRTVAQVAISDPDATVDGLRAAHERVLAAGAQQERLVQALLTLARGQAGIDRREDFDLAQLTADIMLSRAEAAEQRELTVRSTLEPALVLGDAALAEQMITNLVDNALRHNIRHGLVEITTGTENGRSRLTVANTGREIPESAIPQLFQPFERLGAERVGRNEGLGLGLSIVQAIAEAHHAELETVTRPGGGLIITVRFREAESSGAPGPVESRAVVPI